MRPDPTPPVAPGPALAAAVADLATAAARVGELVTAGALTDLPTADRPVLTVALHRAADRATAAATIATGVVHRDGLLPNGHVSTTRWLIVEAKLSSGEASATLGQACALDERYPMASQAWIDGRISRGAVRTITQGVDVAMRSLPYDDRAAQRVIAEDTLVALAAQASVDTVARAVGRLKVLADPEGAAQAVADSHDDQTLAMHPDGVGVRVDGYLSAETAAALLTVLDRIVDRWHREGTLPAEAVVLGDDALADRRRRRTRPHLLALALGHLATRMLDTGSVGHRHDVRPHVTLTVDATRLEAGLGGELALPGLEPVLLPSPSVARILCDSYISLVVTSGDCPRGGLADLLRDHRETVLYSERGRRLVSARLRRLLEVRDRHCAFPGCRVDVSRTQAHHVLPWEMGGPTTLSNLVLLCSRHHHAVHEGGWVMQASGLGAAADPGHPEHWQFDPPGRSRRPSQLGALPVTA